MAIGGMAELLFGVQAERRSLEEIAEPLTAEDVKLDEQVEPDMAGATEEAATDTKQAAQPERAEPPALPPRPRTGASGSDRGRPRPHRGCGPP